MGQTGRANSDMVQGDIMEKQITLIIDSLGQGGAENVCVNLCNHLTDRGWAIELRPLHLDNSPLLAKVNSSVKLTPFGVRNIRSGCLRIARSLKLSGPQHILVFNFQTAVFLIILKKIGWIKSTLIIRNISTLSQKRKQAEGLWSRYIVHPLTQALYRYGDHFIAQSEGMMQDLVEHYKLDRNKIEVIHNPLRADIEDASENAALVNSPRENIILAVGRLKPVKGYDHAITAFAGFVKQHPEFRLRFVGEGPERNNLEDLARELGCLNKIEFVPFTSDVVPHYKTARATILTSLYEGFPNILIESIALGTPVVAYDCRNGPSEIITEANGILVPYRDTGALQNALDDVAKKSWTRDQIAASANQYRSKKIIDTYERFLDKCMKD